MPTLVNYRGEDELYHGRSLYHNSMDVYTPPQKRARISAPFVLWGNAPEQKTGSSSSSINVLPDECLFEILRHLPAQERSTCACVSKHWLTILTTIRRSELCNNNDMQEDGVVGLSSKILEGKKATDIRLASIAIRGGIERVSIRGSGSITTFGMSALARGCPSLKSLSLWNVSNVDDEGLVEIANECNMLERLDLCQCPLITNKGLIAIAEKCPNLSSLSIESCPNIGNDSIQAISQCCIKLESISIKDCPVVGDQGIASLLSSSSTVLSKLKLQRLNISDFSLAVIGHYGKSLTNITLSTLRNVSEKGFWVMGKAQGLNSLSSLSICSCSGLTDLSLEAISKGCLSLKQIFIRNCPLVSDNGLLAFSKSSQSLETLHLEDCNWVTLSGLICALAYLSSKLKSLTLVKCMGLKDIISPFQKTPQIHCSSLRTLSIKNCPGFGSASLGLLGKMCPNLRNIDLSGLYGLTDNGILSLLENCHSGLVKVNLSGCINLSDESVQNIARMHGETLKVLHLENCRKISDISLLTIANFCHLLLDLDVSNCCGVTDSGIASLSRSSDLNLQILSISGCGKISNKSLPFLMQLGRNLVGLNLKHCNSLSVKCVNTLVGNLWRCDILC